MTKSSKIVNILLIAGIVLSLLTSLWGSFIVVYLPSTHQFKKFGLCGYNRYTSLKKKTQQLLRKLNIPFIDTAKVLTSDNLTFIYGYYDFQLQGHLNPEGYKLVAQEVVRYLENHSLYPLRDKQ